jgi:hypothetical protein
VRRVAVSLVALAFVPAALGGYGPAKRDGTITAAVLPEVSGLTAATAVPGGWWVVNDSGHTADLHLIDRRGTLLATVRVRNAANVDWEDLASASGAAGTRVLYIGDIGDNDHARRSLVVYRVGEPERNARSVTATALPFRYPDGRHDAEALLVDPASGRIYVVVKTREPSSEPCALYRFPLPLRPGRRVTLERVGGPFAREIAPVALVTGAAVSHDGTRLVLRTYFRAWEWRRRPGTPFESVFQAPPEHVVLALERQGESIAYTGDDRGLVTTSEQLPAPLWRIGSR